MEITRTAIVALDFSGPDIQPEPSPSWGLADELAIHQNLFEAMEAGTVDSLSLAIQHGPAAPVGDRWSIVDWTDMPRPLIASGPSLPVEPTTWGALEWQFHD